MKHLHMLMAVITIGLYLYQVGLVFSGKGLTLSRAFKGASHAIYTVLMVTGLYLLWQLWQVAGTQHWAIAKIVLLVVAVSANIKALRANDLTQKRAGMVIAGIAYASIVLFAITKPLF